jgi:uncharacterized membrane protein YgcG
VLALVAVIGLLNGWSRSMVVAVAAALAVATIAGCVAYWPLLPQRTAAGSAVALQVESFRRFLESSEARHVEWAWQQGLLREYTAWAVALGAADAWGDALARSAVPPEAVAQATPLTMYGTAGLWNATRTPPTQAGTSSGGGGGFGGGSSGGFSGGSVGGGGGGGSSGSW